MSVESLKVVFVNRYYDPDQSATSQMLTDLARGLALRRFVVHVVASRQLYDDPVSRLAVDEVIAGVRIHRVATTRFGRGHLIGRALDYASFYMSCVLKLLCLLRRGDVLVAKTDPPLLSIVAAPIVKLRSAALINWQQDIFPEVASHLGVSPWPVWLDKWVRRIRDSSLRAAFVNVLIGGRMREYLAGRGIPDSKLDVIENWADGDAIRPRLPSASKLRQRLNLVDRFVVCYSGNLGRAHEFDTLLGAAELLKTDPAFVFLIIGGGAKIDSLKHCVAGRALENFIFLPHQPRDALDDSLSAADVHIVSLLPVLEGLIVPSKLYGILAAGRPLIFVGDADGETARVIQRKACGVQVGVGDARSLTACLRVLAVDVVEREAMGVRARRLFSEEYSLPRAIDRWTELLDVVRRSAG